eukprot:TRINITY_DN24354_c0_g1_i1.p1 TRINITY_DN24354_c0_g1~~TRINITY_DN24354_c0_g1_i1.p1  ORF type:complete len:970 (+),score=194.39 TRINITY_DN24354_c0_g1_i1:67-2910(+)
MSAEVRLKVLELYNHHDASVKQAADAALQEFVKADLAWSVSQELLGDADGAVQFFGAQTLCTKVQDVVKGYDKSSAVDLMVLASSFQQMFSSPGLSQQSKQKLVMALAAIAVHLCTGRWPSAVSDILALGSAQPRHAWCCLLTIPEQLSSVVHGYLKTDKRTEALLGSSSLLVAAAQRLGPQGADESASATLSDSEFSLALQCLTQWAKVMGLPLVQHDGFAAFLVKTLNGPAGSSEVVMELVLEVLRSSPGAFMIYEGGQQPAANIEGVLAALAAKMSDLLPSLQQMADQPPTTLDDANSARLRRWAQVAFTLIEAYTQLLWLDKSAADVLIAFLGGCFAVHPHVAQSVFELWAVLKDANRDSKIPAGVMATLLKQLAPFCITSFVRFSRLDSPFSEDADELAQLRDSQSDIIVDMFCIAAGTPEALQILALLYERLQAAAAAKDWHGIEVAWRGFSGIAEVLADEPSIPEVYQTVLQSIFASEVTSEDQCATAAMLLRTCGPHFGQSLRPLLAPSVQWLVGKVPVVPTVASEAVQELCGYAGQHLLPHVEEFLKIVVATAPSVSAEVDSSLHGALVGIIRGLPGEQAVGAFVKICEGTTQAVAAGFDVTQEPARVQLHRCSCRLLRCALVMEQAGSPDNKETCDVAARTAAAALTHVLQAQWSSLAPASQRLLCAAVVPRDAPKGKPIFEYSDEAVQVNTLALLRYAAKAATGAPAGGKELGVQIMLLAAACCKEGQFAALSSVAILANSPPMAVEVVLPAMDTVCQAALGHIQAGRSAEDLVPFLDLIAALAASAGDGLCQLPQLSLLTQLCVLAVRSTDQDVLKPVLLFLQKLAMSRTDGARVQNMQEVIQAVLLHFHLWPRSVGGHVYKLFQAFVERHEAVFLPLAVSPSVPSVATLPAAEQAIAHRAFQSLRGPRFRAFLGDLGAVARGDNQADVLQVYAE